MGGEIIEIKRSVSFFLERRKSKDGKLITTNVPIRISITYSGNRVMSFAGYRIDASKWDDKKSRAKNNTTHLNNVTHLMINAKLDRLSSEIHNFFKECEVAKNIPTTAEVKTELNRLISDKTKKVDTFYNVFDKFVKTVGRENNWGNETFEKFAILKRHLEGFDKNLSFEKFNSDRLLDYISYLRETKGNRNTTIAKNIDFVKWFLKWAANNNYQVSKSALDFKPKLKGTDGSLKNVIFLTIDELKYLYALELPLNKSYLERVRDVFVFCCFTGMRYSDVYNLKRNYIKENYIEFVTKKTSNLLRVELNNYSRSILEKYKNVQFENDKALPVITNQKMNEYLKELGQLAGLDTPETIVYFIGSKRVEEIYPKYLLLSTHCARKSFVTNLIYLGVSDHIIRQWTGHRDLKSFDVYHKIVDEVKSREMAKFDNI